MRESRRDFFRKAPKRVALIGAVAQSIFTSSCNILPPIDRSFETQTVMQAASEGSLLGTASIIFNYAMRRLGIRTGNAGGDYPINPTSDMPIGQRVFSDLFLNAIVPPMEEYLFRVCPSKYFLGDQKGIRWDIGMPLSFAFALGHNVVPLRLLENKSPIAFDRIPIEQFVGGLLFWKKYRETDFITVTVMHSVSNLIPSLPLEILSRLSKK